MKRRLIVGGLAGALAALAVLVGCSPSAVPAPVSAVAPEAEDIAEAPEPIAARPAEHVVAKGETLSAIALNYGLDYRELSLWNDLRDPNLIQPGQRLRLAAREDQPVVAVVGKQSAVAFSEPAPAAVAAPSPRLTVIGEKAKDAATAALAETAPLKTTPQAVKHVYSPERLEKLRLQWREKRSAEPAASAAPVPPAAEPAAANLPASAAVAAPPAPAAARRRFGVDWGWPTAAAPDEKFNEARKGVRFYGARGDPVYASANGKVIYVGSGVKAYGKTVVIKHENDFLTAYAHNDKVLAREGDVVRRGDKIAEFGDSGAERIMLHFEVRKTGKPFDPLQVLPAAR